jgi:hypothetical protein
MCEPLLFDAAERIFQQAEAIYEKEHFTEVEIIKFKLKKSSFLKKWGFFYEALDILADCRKQLESLAPKSAKEGYLCKKHLFKLLRDEARLYALLRQETNAHEAHRKAERIYREELIPMGGK